MRSAYLVWRPCHPWPSRFLRDALRSVRDAERPGLHSHAERGNENGGYRKFPILLSAMSVKNRP